MQQALFEPALLPCVVPPPPAQRWWRLQGDARRRGRGVEPLLVTPRFLARIDSAVCPVQRTPLGPRTAVVVALRDDATVAAGHLATLSPAAAAATPGRWQDAWAAADTAADTAAATSSETGPLDAAAWRRLAVLRSFVQPLQPAEVARLPLHVLPPNRLRVLSPVQGLQVAATLALRGADRAVRLLQMATLARDEDTRQALRVWLLTLLARCPADLDRLAPAAARQALEDLWADALLQRRWERLALRLADHDAERLLLLARRRGLLGRAWRPLEAGFATDGWDVQAPESSHVAAPTRLVGPVLAAGRRRHAADAAAAAAGGR
jgi:hypothetical protein